VNAGEDGSSGGEVLHENERHVVVDPLPGVVAEAVEEPVERIIEAPVAQGRRVVGEREELPATVSCLDQPVGVDQQAGATGRSRGWAPVPAPAAARGHRSAPGRPRRVR
jgi:hypothetical protein